MGTLNAALAWAQRGFAVFPLQENTRGPAFAADWTTLATTDPERIKQLWTDPVLGTEYNYNVGCSCTDMVVVDIDVKNGKKGVEEYEQLGGHYDTLVVRTTTGGYHCYFYGPDSNNAPLASGVDVRSRNGYVVAPGSSINGSPYEIINDRDMAWVPLSIESRLQAAYSRRDVEMISEKDTPASVQAAINFLQSCPPAIEGMRGDETTFKTAARLIRELALSTTMAYKLMLEHYNPRCSPPWSAEEIWDKVQNAEHYGSADYGLLAPDALIKGAAIEVQPPPSLFARTVAWGNAEIPEAMRPRDWLIERMLMHKAVSLLLATGSAGKSTLSLALAAHLAVGKDFAGFKVRRRCKTIVYNGEDDREEQSRRLYAICYEYRLDYEEVKQNIMLISNRDFKLQVVVKPERHAVRNDAVVNQLIELASEKEVGCIVLDPLVKIHQCDEGNNVEMDIVMDVLSEIAVKANIAMFAIHHTSKALTAQENRVGNADVSRGASAIVNASRVAFTLFNASEQDALDFGISANEVHHWARLDDAKMNLSLASDRPVWFRRLGITIPSGDAVGVMKYEVLEKSTVHIKIKIADLVLEQMPNGSTLPMAKAVALCKQHIPLWKNKTDIAIRRELEGLFAVAIDRNGRALKVIRDGAGEDKLLFTING